MSRFLIACPLLALAFCAACLRQGPPEQDEAPNPPLPELTNSIGMKLVLIPPGKFLMGSPKEEEHHEIDEEPRREVEISKPFYLGAFEVTQAQYRQIMGTNPSFYSPTGDAKDEVKGLNTDDFPVERVSWHDAKQFCVKLSALPAETKAGRVYRLPAEAEWEYACRAGTTTPFHFGKSLSADQANFDERVDLPGENKGEWLGRTTKVGSYKPNAFGLFDMHGNVLEWCEDWYKRDYYN